MAKNKKLYKVNEGKMIDGVCAGIAEYFDADPTVIRLLWILFCAIGGSGILAYIRKLSSRIILGMHFK